MQRSRQNMNNHHSETMANLEAYREEVKRREMDKIREAAIGVALCSVPVRFKGKTFADFHLDYDQQHEVKQLVQRYAETFSDRLAEGTCLIFSGKTGTGKSLLAYVLYQYLIQKEIHAEYQPSIQFLRLLHEKQFESYHSFAKQLNHYQTLPLLIIDEVTEGCGKGACPADWERHLFRMLIDARYAAKRPTLVITNRDKQGLIERLCEPAIDRLLEKGIFLAFNWQSYRQQ